MANEIVSRSEQERRGLLRPSQQNFVTPDRYTRLESLPAHQTMMDVVHPATQQVVVHTSAVDRAKGYQVMIAPAAVVVAVLAVLVSLVFDNELLSFASILIFWISFAAIYLAGWILTAAASPEFVSWYSAKRQWDVIEREQVERWGHYRWQTGREPSIAPRPWWVAEVKPWLYVVSILWILFVVALVFGGVL